MEHTNDLFKQALKYHHKENLINAAALYLKIYDVQSQHIDAVFLLGTLYLQS